MNNSRRTARRALAATLAMPLGWAALADPAQADTVEIAPDMIVTASAEPLPTKEVASSYTIITAKEIEAHQYRSLPEALNAVPGIHVVQSGGSGTLTSTFSRGANSNQTLVLLNGEPIGDPSSPNNAFNFADFTLDNVERIEVVRGPQSALYGSQAMGGVINIITKRGKGEPVSTLRVEAGTLGTLNTGATSGGSFGKTNYFFSIARTATDGNDITPQRYRYGAPEEKDGYENMTGSFRLDSALNENVTAFVFGQFVDALADLDGGEDLHYKGKTQELYLNGSLSGRFACGTWRPKLSLAYARTNRNDNDRPDTYSSTDTNVNNHGERFTARFDNALDLADWNTLSFGGLFMRESFDANGYIDYGWGTITIPRSDVGENATAVYASDHLTFGERWFATVSARYDMPQEFGNQASFTVAPGYYHPETDTKLTFSYGTAFKVPSLYQRFGYSPYSSGGGFTGNPDLKPEKSRGWEVGVDQGLFGTLARTGITYFANRIEDPVVEDWSAYPNVTTKNDPSFDSHGVESYVEVNPFAGLTTRVDYTFTVMEPGTKSSFSRRPRHQVNFDATWKIDERTQLSGSVNYYKLYRDIAWDTGASFAPSSYTVVNLAASRKLTEAIEITAKVNNLFDRRYEPADGYSAPGIEALAGLAVTF